MDASIGSSACSSPSTSVSSLPMDANSATEVSLGMSMAPTTCTSAVLSCVTRSQSDVLPGSPVANAIALETAGPSVLCSDLPMTHANSSSTACSVILPMLTSTPSRKRKRSLDRWKKNM